MNAPLSPVGGLGVGRGVLSGAAGRALASLIRVEHVGVNQVLAARANVGDVARFDVPANRHRRDVEPFGCLLDGEQLTHASQDSAGCAASNTLVDYTPYPVVQFNNGFFD